MLNELKRAIHDEIFAPVVGIAAGGLFLYAVYKNWDSIILFVEKSI